MSDQQDQEPAAATESGSALDKQSALDTIGAIVQVRERRRGALEKRREREQEDKRIQRETAAKEHRDRRIKRWVSGIVSVVAIVSATLFIFGFFDSALKNPVAVLLPSPKSSVVKDNAMRQWAGFEVAFAGFSKIDAAKYEVEARADNGRRSHYCFFQYPPVPHFTRDEPYDKEHMAISADDQSGDASEECSKNLFHQFEWWYNEGKRVFVVTMSGTVLNIIRGGFDTWAKDKGDDRPVLVATVASAPDIASREQGRFRYYVRSRDEINVFLTHIDAKNQGQPALFRIQDDYGQKAGELLINDHQATAAELEFILAPGHKQLNPKTQVERWRDSELFDRNMPVIVVAYGNMIRDLLEEIRALRDPNGGPLYTGDVLIASTYTECAWQLDMKFNEDGECKSDTDGDEVTDTGTTFRERIYTVGAGSPKGNMAPEDYGVVYQMSERALSRALDCGFESYTAKKPYFWEKRDSFWTCWSKETSNGVEITANGDSSVSLRLVRHWDLPRDHSRD